MAPPGSTIHGIRRIARGGGRANQTDEVRNAIVLDPTTRLVHRSLASRKEPSMNTEEDAFHYDVFISYRHTDKSTHHGWV